MEKTPNVKKQEYSLLHNKIAVISDVQAITPNIACSNRIAAVATLLCTEGCANILLNNRRLTLSAGDLLVSIPGDIIEGDGVETDFRTIGFYLSREFFEELKDIPFGLVNAQTFIAEHPVTHLNESGQRVFTQYYELIRSKLSEDAQFSHSQLVTNLLIQAFMYEFHDAMEGALEIEKVEFTSGEMHFKNFIELLLKTYPKPRSVAWYADKLNISPKYLSNVCKTHSGHTASAAINKYVLEDVKRMLMRPEKSVKQIVRELDFPSISFFGKYVKKHLGMSPKHYRQQLSQQTEKEYNVKK